MPTFLLASINSAVFQLKRGGFFQCIKFGWNNIALVDLISIFKNRHKKHTIGEGAAFVYLSGITLIFPMTFKNYSAKSFYNFMYTVHCTVHGSSQYFNEWLPGSNFHLSSLCVKKCKLYLQLLDNNYDYIIPVEKTRHSLVCHSQLISTQYILHPLFSI